MPLSQAMSFVLWGKQFDEAPAAFFVTELRKAGFKVKMVGLDGRQTPGCSGLALVPDFTLSQALAYRGSIACVIFPCHGNRSRWLKTDPRILQLIHSAQSEQALFVVSQTWSQIPEAETLLPVSEANIAMYPDVDDLVGFVQELAVTLEPRMPKQ